MKFLFSDAIRDGLWLAVYGAVGSVLDFLFARRRSLWETITSTFAGVASSVLLTDPVLSWFQWDPHVYRNALAFLLGLLGRNLLRRVWTAARSATSFVDALRRLVPPGGDR